MMLDLVSHWFHVFSAGDGHHKDAAGTLGTRPRLLRWYYGAYPLFAYCCVAETLFLLLLVPLAHEPALAALGVPVAHVAWRACFPGFVVKQIINGVQLWSACQTLVLVQDCGKKA